MDELKFITMEFDDGEARECEILGVFDVGEKEYIALVPRDDSGDVYIYGYEETGKNGFRMREIEDDGEFAAVIAEFERLMDELEEEEK